MTGGLLSLALALSLMPGMRITAMAETVTTLQSTSIIWSGDSAVAGDVEINSRVTVTADMELMIPAGRTLTVRGGIDAGGNASGNESKYTLTVTGGGSLCVTGTKGEKGSPGTKDTRGGTGGTGGAGFTGNLIVDGAAVNVTGGEGGEGGEGFDGGEGGMSLDGNITVKNGTVNLTGGNGGGGGGKGGTGCRDSVVTVNGGSVNVTGGAGGGGGDGGNGGTGGDGCRVSVVTVNGGSVNVTGGNGGTGGNSASVGDHGGNGGNGGYDSAITVNGGFVEVAGGAGGDGVNGFDGGDGGDGGTGWIDWKNRPITVRHGLVYLIGGAGGKGGEGYRAGATGSDRQAAPWVTIDGPVIEESGDGSTWSDVSANTSDKRYVRVRSVDVSAISLDKASAGLTVGGTESLTAVISPDEASYRSVKWSVKPGGSRVKLYADAACSSEIGADATSALTVYAKGTAAGTAKITVTATNGTEDTGDNKKAVCDVTVTCSVTITGCAHAAASGGATCQTGLSGAMTPVVYTADAGYFFPVDYSVDTVNGISVTRNSSTRITVSGTPTADTKITLKAPTEMALAYESYLVTTEANRSKSGDALTALRVTFCGRQWYIIEDDSTASDAGTVTLLAADTDFGTCVFNGNDISNAYKSSTVKAMLDALTASDSFFVYMAEAIADTALPDVGVTNARLFLLSYDEADALPSQVKKIDFKLPIY